MLPINIKLILLFSICILSIKAKKPSKMLTIPLKVINTTFEKYPTSDQVNQKVEEVPVKTIFGTKMIRRVIEEPDDISGNISKVTNSLFVAPIKIGGQDFNVILDTGSVNLWVPKIGSKDQAIIAHHYDPSKSSSSSSTSETFEIQYGTGSTKGNYYSDYINFITNSAYNVLFGAATETVFDVEGADGIIQFMDVQVSLIGQPFFMIFHTKFDYENKVLKFHTTDEKAMIYSYAKPNDDEATHFDPDGIVTSWFNEKTVIIIAIVASCIAVIFIIVIIVRCSRKNCGNKNRNILIEN
jgi:hypothetical protein